MIHPANTTGSEKGPRAGGLTPSAFGIAVLQKWVHQYHLDGWVAGVEQKPGDEIAVLLQK